MRQGAELRSKVEAAIGRYKRVIGDALRSREDARRVCEVKIAVKASRARSEEQQATLMLHKTREQHAPEPGAKGLGLGGGKALAQGTCRGTPASAS